MSSARDNTRKKRKTVKRPATAAAGGSGTANIGGPISARSAQEAADVRSEIENFERSRSALQKERVETNVAKFRSGARNNMHSMHMRKMRRAFARTGH